MLEDRRPMQKKQLTSTYSKIRDSVITQSEERGAEMPLVRSRERVRSQAEVYTRNEEINAMLDLMEDISYNIDSRFLEPSCGNGNFLVRILERKLTRICADVDLSFSQRKKKKLSQKDFEFAVIRATSSIYGIDILKSNVEEARERMKVAIRDRYSDHLNTQIPTEGFWDSVDYVLEQNIICGDMLNGTKYINVTEFTSPKIYKIRQLLFRMDDLISEDLMGNKLRPRPIKEIVMKNYWELGIDV